MDVQDLTDEAIQILFDLYARYFDGCDGKRFAADLRGKDRVIALYSGESVVGFTTLSHYPFAFAGKTVAVVFSGDTIIDRPFWGSPRLSLAWLREAAGVAALYPAHRLYWFLIVKGHRTYRFMPTFGHHFVPHWRADAQDPCLLALRDALAQDRFGDAYDPQRGIVSFGGALDRLGAAWAEPGARELERADVQFFLRANPGYREGDELACLCPLTPENMRPLARRVFLRGPMA